MTTRTSAGRAGIVRGASWLDVGSVGAQWVLNAASAILVVATLGHVGDSDLVLDGLWVSLALGAFVFGLRATLLRIVIVTAIVPGSSVVATANTPGWTGFELPELVEWSLMVVLTMLIAVTADRAAVGASRYAALYRQASNRLVSVHEDERAILARDLHDGVGQALTAVVLTLDAAEAAVGGAPGPQPARIAIQRARRLAAGALDETRDVATRLRPARLQELGLGAAVRDLAGSAGVPVDVRFEPSILPPRLLQPGREIDAYRIIQEAVSNAARHSHATSVWIDADIRDGGVRFEVGDNGVGFDWPTTPAALGLAGMQERAAILFGSLEVRSKPGSGTRVGLFLPVLAPRAGLKAARLAIKQEARM